MKYYFKYDHFSRCLEDCPNKMLHDNNNNIKKIGAWPCEENCENFINISLDDNNKKYIECKYINNQERLKKLNYL
jgi:hypothetical protein